MTQEVVAVDDFDKSTYLTMEQFQKVLPPQMKKTVNQELLDRINNTVCNPIEREAYRDNILGYVGVMRDGKFKVVDYLNAVRYCSHKLLGDTNIAAYVKTFPDRYQYFLNNGTSEKDIASYVSGYNKNKLVNLIMEQSIIPTYVLNQDIQQDAINHLANLMKTANSEKVQCDAATSLLTHLKVPETKKVELDIGVKQDRSTQELKELLRNYGEQQLAQVESGKATALDIAHSVVVTPPPEDDYEIKDIN